MRSQTISAVHDASGTTRSTSPKRVLSWWWSMLRMCEPLRLTMPTGVRSMLPQSRKTTMRSSRSAGACGDEPVERQEAVLVRQRQLVGRHEHDRVLAQRGEDAVHRHQRAERVAVGMLVGDEQEALRRPQLVEHACARASTPSTTPLTRRPPAWSSRRSTRAARRAVSSSANDELGRVLEAQLGGDTALQEAVGGAQALEAGGTLGVVAEDAHVDAGVAEVGAGLTAVTVTNPTRGSLRLASGRR